MISSPMYHIIYIFYNFNIYMGLIGFESQFYHLLAVRSHYEVRRLYQQMARKHLYHWD